MPQINHSPIDNILSFFSSFGKPQATPQPTQTPKQKWDHQIKQSEKKNGMWEDSEGVIHGFLGGHPQAAEAKEPLATPTDAPIPQYIKNMSNDPGLPYNSVINSAAKQYGMPAPLLKATLAHESMQFNPKYVTGYHTDGTGRGVAGIDKNAHPEITDQQAFDPSFAIPFAAKTISGYKQQEGTWTNALKRYNGGGNYDSSVPGYEGVPVKVRTTNYANNVFHQANDFGTNLATESAN